MEKNRDTLCGRTSQEPFQVTKGKTSESSSKQSCKPKTKPLQYLDLRNGTDPAVSWQTLSLAWRTFDAQYWGVPQRRKRIYLVADFDGERAGKILFEQEGLRGNSSKSVQKWKDLTETSGRSTDLSSEYRMTMFENHGRDTRYNELKNSCSILTAALGTGGNNQPLVTTYDVRFTSDGTKNARANVYETDVSRTLSTGGTSPDANQGGIAIVSSFSQDAYDKYTESDVSATLKNSG